MCIICHPVGIQALRRGICELILSLTKPCISHQPPIQRGLGSKLKRCWDLATFTILLHAAYSIATKVSKDPLILVFPLPQESRKTLILSRYHLTAMHSIKQSSTVKPRVRPARCRSISVYNCTIGPSFRSISEQQSSSALCILHVTFHHQWGSMLKLLVLISRSFQCIRA